MSIFDSAIYATRLGVSNVTTEYAYMQGFLAYIEKYLSSQYGLEFGSTSSTRQIRGTDTGVRILPTPYVRNITNITQKCYTDSTYSVVLAANTDYITSSVRTSPYPIYQLQLNYIDLAHPYYIDVTGVWFYADSVPEDIQFLVLEVLQKGLAGYRYNQEMMSNSGKDIKSTKIGNVAVTYGSGSSNNQSDSSSTSTNYGELISNSPLDDLLNSVYSL